MIRNNVDFRANLIGGDVREAQTNKPGKSLRVGIDELQFFVVKRACLGYRNELFKDLRVFHATPG